MADPTEAPPASPVPPIRTHGLFKRFGDNEVLRGVDLECPRGQITVILGGSGSGKSVLMKHLIGLLKPDAGRVEVEGVDISTVRGEELKAVRGKFGMVFQGAALFDSMTVFENVAFPLWEHRRELSSRQVSEIVHHKLSFLKLDAAASRFPSDLSGGMRKRVGLARAVVLDPEIVLYDEPTTGLDPLTTDQVDEMIKSAAENLGVTSVVISHDVASAFSIADRMAFLDQGRIVEYGSPDVVRQSRHAFVREFLDAWFLKGTKTGEGRQDQVGS